MSTSLLNGTSCCIVTSQGEVAEIAALFEKLGGKRAWAGSAKQEMLLSSQSAVNDPVNTDRLLGLVNKGLKIVDSMAWLKECSKQKQRVSHLPYLLRLPEEQLPQTRSSISFFDDESVPEADGPDLEEIEEMEQQQHQQQPPQEEQFSVGSKPTKLYFQPSGLPAGASNSATLAKFGPSRPISLPGGGFVRKATLEEISSLDSTLHDFRILHICSMEENKNKYYVLELTERGTSHLIITHYGRVGEGGTYEIRMFRSAKDANNYFGQLCSEKYVKKGYRDMALDSCFVGTKKLQSTISEARSTTTIKEETLETTNQVPPCREVLELVDTIYSDANKALSSILGAELTGDGIRTGVGILNSEQIRRASSVLDQIQVILFSPGGSRNKNDLLKLSQELYSTIPHKLVAGAVGCAVQSIDSISDLTEKRDLLQLMTDVTNAQVRNALSNSHEASQKYFALGCSIESLNPAAEQFRTLQKMTENDIRKCGISLKKAFRITRPLELRNFEKGISGRKDLLHGTKASSVLGILRRGLLMPLESEKNGRQRTNFGWLGTGIYFSDTPCSVTRYAEPSAVTGSSFALVCQVACGNTKQVTDYLPHLTSAPFGFDSVQGMGTEMPGASGSSSQSVFQDNEIVVYRQSQFTIEYLLELNVQNRLPKPKDPPINSLPAVSEPQVVGLENDDNRVRFGENKPTNSSQDAVTSFADGGTIVKPADVQFATAAGKSIEIPVSKNPFFQMKSEVLQATQQSNPLIAKSNIVPKPPTPTFASLFSPTQGIETFNLKQTDQSKTQTPASVKTAPVITASVNTMLIDHEDRILHLESILTKLPVPASQPENQSVPFTFGSGAGANGSGGGFGGDSGGFGSGSGFGNNSGGFGSFGGDSGGFGNGGGFGNNSGGFGSGGGFGGDSGCFGNNSGGFGSDGLTTCFGTGTKGSSKAKKAVKQPCRSTISKKKEAPKPKSSTKVKFCAVKKTKKIPTATKINTDPDANAPPRKRFQMPKSAKEFSDNVPGELSVSEIPSDPNEVNSWILKREKEMRLQYASGSNTLGCYSFLLNVYSREVIPTFVREPFTNEESAAGKILTQYVQNQHPGSASILCKSGFEAAMDNMTLGQLDGLDWSNVIMAGGGVLGSMLPENIGTGESFRGSDIDLFVYGCATDPQGLEVIERIIECVRTNRSKSAKPRFGVVRSKKTPKLQFIRTPHAVTILGEYPYRHVQIVLRMYTTPAETLVGFDVDSCAVAYDGKTVWASPRARRAINKQINTIDLTRRSLTYEIRLAKYAKRGFGVLIPGLDLDYAVKQTQPVKVLNGLAKLMALDRDEDNLCNTRKLGFLQKRRTTTDYSGSTDDEKCLASDYSNVFLPWGPAWGSWHMGQYLESRDKAHHFNKVKENPSYHAHIAIRGPNVLSGFSSWCPKCTALQKKMKKGCAPAPSKIQMGWESKSDVAAEKEALCTYVFGQPRWMRENPGTQLMTGSFHPVEDNMWMDGAVSKTLNSYVKQRMFLRPRISDSVWKSYKASASNVSQPMATSPQPMTVKTQIYQSLNEWKDKQNTREAVVTSKGKNIQAKQPTKSKKTTPLLEGEVLEDTNTQLVKRFGTILEIQSPKLKTDRVFGEGSKVVGFSLNDTIIVPSDPTKKYSNSDTDWKLKYDEDSMKKTISEATKTGARVVIFADQPGIELGYVKISTAVSRVSKILELLEIPDGICYLSTSKDVCKKPGTAMFDLFLTNNKLKSVPTDMLYVGSKSGEYDAVDWKFAKNCGMEFELPDVYFTNAASVAEPIMAFMPNTVTEIIRLWEDQSRAGQTVIRIPEFIKDNENDCSPQRFGIVLSGIPKGGKSLYAKCAFQGKNVLVTEYHPADCTPEQRLQHETRLLLASRMGATIVFDGQNTTAAARKHLINLINGLSLVPASIHLDTPPAVARHLNQVGGQKFGNDICITDSVFESYSKSFEQPSELEGFEHVEVIPFTACFENAADEQFFHMFP